MHLSYDRPCAVVASRCQDGTREESILTCLRLCLGWSILLVLALVRLFLGHRGLGCLSVWLVFFGGDGQVVGSFLLWGWIYADHTVVLVLSSLGDRRLRPVAGRLLSVASSILLEESK